MAFFVMLFDRPADVVATGYKERAKNWIAALARLEGFVEFSSHWNAQAVSPNTMVLVELENTGAALKALDDPEIREVLADMEHHGCSNIKVAAFKSSEITPLPIRR